MAIEFIQGAEATVEMGAFLGQPVLRKRRLVKAYRHPELDARLRDERTRDEANLLVAARKAGVPVPVVHDIDRAEATIAMECVPGQSLRATLQSEATDESLGRFAALGQIVAAMHNGGIVHGDLTTSNVLVPDNHAADSLVVIDFGLGQATEEDEPRAVDLHLMEEALEATHPEADRLMAAMLETYLKRANRGVEVMRRLEGVRERGRYRGAT